MILIDANLLLYAYNPPAKNHAKAHEWLEEVLSGPELVGLAWLTILAFLRIGTSSRAFARPFSPAEAVSIVSEWLERPNVQVFGPGERHWSILSELLTAAQAHGPLVMDAYLAALAIEHGAILCSTDRDFTRFAGLQFRNPLEA